MNLNISGQHVEVTQPLKDYVMKRFSRVEDHVDNITSAHVVLSVEKLQQKAEIQIHVTGKELFASASNEDMYAAIDAMMDKIHKQAIKHKQKANSHKDKDKDNNATSKFIEPRTSYI